MGSELHGSDPQNVSQEGKASAYIRPKEYPEISLEALHYQEKAHPNREGVGLPIHREGGFVK